MGRPEAFTSAFLDSNVMIAIAAGEAERADDCIRLLHLADAGKLQLYISTVAYVECRRGSKGNERVQNGDSDDTLRKILANPRITLVELDRPTAKLARELGLSHGLRTWDAVHLASAVQADAEVFFTYDAGFPLESCVRGVWCDKPYAPGGPDLFNH